MNKPFALAPFVFLGLVGASPPPPDGPGPDPEAYPPCSATITDRCVQRHERHVRRGPLPELDSVAAAPAPAPVQVSGGDYPPCTAERQDRCTQIPRRAAPTRYAMNERERIRIGERG